MATATGNLLVPKLLGGKHLNVPEILNTTKISYHLERIIDEATVELWLVSPYVKIHQRLQSLLRRKMSEGLTVTLIYGKQQMHEEMIDFFEDAHAAQIYFCKNLHAKVYSSESEHILSSLNLYDYSQVHNYELGCLIQKSTDEPAFHALARELQVIREGSAHQERANPQKLADVVEPEFKEKLSTTQIAKLLKVSTKDVFGLLKNEGLIVRQNEQWMLTPAGIEYGGEVIRSRRYGEFIVWPKDIVEVN